MTKRKKQKMLSIDEGMQVAADAGVHPEKDGELNLAKKAGLKSIKKRKTPVTSEGEKPTTVKVLPVVKKHRLLKGIAISVAAVVLLLSVFAVGGALRKKSNLGLFSDLGLETAKSEIPADKTPEDYMKYSDALYNVAFMHQRFDEQTEWSCYYHGVVKTNTPIDQDVQTWKHFKDGRLISCDLTTSKKSFMGISVENARQFCVADGRVIAREYWGKASSYNGQKTPWDANSTLIFDLPVEAERDAAGNIVPDESRTPTESDKAPVYDFKTWRGLPPTEFSVYLINGNTLLKATDVEKTEDGLYKQTYTLNPVTYDSTNPEFDDMQKNSAAYYYKYQMVRTGGLSDFPEYNAIEITYYFDSEWRVIKTESSEKYRAEVAEILKTTCDTTGSYTVYSYGTDKVTDVDGTVQDCSSDAYETYFKPILDTHTATATSLLGCGLSVRLN